MRLGLLGGTFDPVHFGHLLLAEQCREQCDLDEVWFVPAGVPPHKQSTPISPGMARAEMLEFATAGHPQFVVSRLELSRNGPTFTVDTLEELTRNETGRELFFLIGSDSLLELGTWRKPARIAELATIVAVNRGDRPLPDLEPLKRQFGEPIVSNIKPVTMPGIDLSSTEIRSRVRQGRSIRYMTPRAVELYIAEHNLYAEASG